MRLIVLGNQSPTLYERAPIGDDPVPLAVQDAPPSETTVRVSVDSTLLQAVSEIVRIWAIQSNSPAPTYIRHNAEAVLIASVLAEHFGVTDIAEVAS